MDSARPDQDQGTDLGAIIAPYADAALHRLARRSEVTADGCWVWNGSTNHGYGHFGVGGKTVPTHRYAYEAMVGAIADGLQIDHLCRVRNCWRPDHLEPVTPKENTRRAPDQPATVNAAKTHCWRGHPLAGGHIRFRDRGNRTERICLQCRSERREGPAGRRSTSHAHNNARKTHCPAGHPYDFHNTYYKPSGDRECRTCRAAQSARRKR